MFAGSGRDGDFDLGVGAGEILKVRFEEGAVGERVLVVVVGESCEGFFDVLHALAATGPVAVVEVDALALENEGADAVL